MNQCVGFDPQQLNSIRIYTTVSVERKDVVCGISALYFCPVDQLPKVMYMQCCFTSRMMITWRRWWLLIGYLNIEKGSWKYNEEPSICTPVKSSSLVLIERCWGNGYDVIRWRGRPYRDWLWIASMRVWGVVGVRRR